MKEHQTPNKAFACSPLNRNGRSKGFPSKKPAKSLLSEEPLVILVPSDLTPEKITDKAEISSASCTSSDEFSSKFNSVEAEIAVKFLRDVKIELLNSVNAAPQYRRKLLDDIIEYVTQDLETYTLPEERAHSANMISMKNRMLFLCTFIWLIGVSIVLSLTSDARNPYRGSPPT